MTEKILLTAATNDLIRDTRPRDLLESIRRGRCDAQIFVAMDAK